MSRRRPKVHARESLPERQTLSEWLEGEARRRWVSRGELWGFSESYLRQRILPLIADCIKDWERLKRQRRWWRRLMAFLFRTFAPIRYGRFVARMRSTLAWEEHLQQDRDENLDIEQHEPPKPAPRSCVVCGTVQLRSVNEFGGIMCENGHVIEEAPDGR